MGARRDWEDVPLPGMDQIQAPARPPRRSDRTGRRHDPQLPITDAVTRSFWNKVVRGPGDFCWIFCGAISGTDGYGRITWQVRGRTRTVSAHRFALMLVEGELADGVIGEHSCNQPLCVRVAPGHLHSSTQSHNMRYAVELGRHRGSTPAARDSLDRVERSRAVRDAVADGWDADRFVAACSSTRISRHQLRIF